MATHKCDKEAMLQEMKDDIKYIRRSLEGNGKKGLVECVDDLKLWRAMLAGGLGVVIVVTGWLISMKPWDWGK